ncbi:MAG: response regulator [Candidatus Omnitrophica bacterium]|nr:response regulator [Candidatus Omnitrophota bacterium]
MSLRVLVVDDEKEMAELMKDLLQMSGISDVVLAYESGGALEYIETHRPDLTFLDIELGGKTSGMEVLKSAMTFSPRTKVCMASAYGDEYEAKSFALGAYAFLKKPFDVESIRQVLSSVVN